MSDERNETGDLACSKGKINIIQPRSSWPGQPVMRSRSSPEPAPARPTTPGSPPVPQPNQSFYALQHLNFAREDHVRSLFRFANGMRINGDTYWLEIHCANCEGSSDKFSLDRRKEWVTEHRKDITAIARDPVGTFDKWM